MVVKVRGFVVTDVPGEDAKELLVPVLSFATVMGYVHRTSLCLNTIIFC